MESRCYQPGAERTHYYLLTLQKRDFIAATAVLVAIVLLYLNR